MQKKRAAPGAEPTMAEPTPRYIPVKPPALKKPAEDWRRVFRVSRGKRVRSTVEPARAPERRAVVKVGCLVWKEDMVNSERRNHLSPAYLRMKKSEFLLVIFFRWLGVCDNNG